MPNNTDVNAEISPSKTQLETTIALLPWGEVWEDFLDEVGITFESFCNEIPFGWMIGYVDALRLAGIQTVLIFPTARFTEPSRFIHKPTGATICMLPVPKSYLAVRRKLKEMRASPSFGKVTGVHASNHLLFKVLKDAAPYLCTPIGLLARELRQQNCSAVLCQDYEYFRFDVCVLLGRLLRLPVFATFQGTLSANWFGRFLRPLTIQSCAGLIIGSQTETQRVSSRYKMQSNKIAKIFNPIDLQTWSAIDGNKARAMFGLPPEAQVVVWHGRVEIQQKGLDILLDAWDQVCQERADRDLRLVMMGSGTDAEKVRQRIAAMPQQNVLWVDKYVTDRTVLRHFLSAGDVYAFPSRHEGLPVAPLEAMACGLPVVAAEASGVSDILDCGENSGGLVVPCNDAAAFALALGSVLDDEPRRQKLGSRARRRVEKYFSLEVVGKQLYDFLLTKI